MRVPTKREMKDVNERVLNCATALSFWKAELGRLQLFKTMYALDRAMKALGFEVTEMRERFDASGHRPKKH